jgi:hypothetical protein
MDPTITRRLVNAKYFYHSGRTELSKNTEVGAYQATINFHDALETFLICIADAVGVSKSRKFKFSDYPGEISNASKEPFSHPGVVDEINDLRVPLKHRVFTPTSRRSGT